MRLTRNGSRFSPLTLTPSSPGALLGSAETVSALIDDFERWELATGRGPRSTESLIAFLVQFLVHGRPPRKSREHNILRRFVDFLRFHPDPIEPFVRKIFCGSGALYSYRGPTRRCTVDVRRPLRLQDPTGLRRRILLASNARPVGAVYFLWDKDARLLYIGQTANLRNRIRFLRRDPRFRDVLFFSYLPCRTRNARLCREAAYIALLRPPLNRHIGLRFREDRVSEWHSIDRFTGAVSDSQLLSEPIQFFRDGRFETPHPASLDRRPLSAVRERIGAVYFLWDDHGSLLYVGQTGDLHERISEHARSKKMQLARYVSWLAVDDQQARLALETVYIALLRPPINQAVLLRVSNGRLSEIRWRHK